MIEELEFQYTKAKLLLHSIHVIKHFKRSNDPYEMNDITLSDPNLSFMFEQLLSSSHQFSNFFFPHNH
jgi:hypothetical protein